MVTPFQYRIGLNTQSCQAICEQRRQLPTILPNIYNRSYQNDSYTNLTLNFTCQLRKYDSLNHSMYMYKYTVYEHRCHNHSITVSFRTKI